MAAPKPDQLQVHAFGSEVDDLPQTSGMLGSRVKLSDRRKMFKINCSCRGTMFLVVLFTVCSLYFGEKEFINKGNLWDDESSSGGNEDGIGRCADGNTVFVCAAKSDAKLPMKYINLADARRVFVEIDYKLTKNVANRAVSSFYQI
jgi:hypothetical protein